MGIRKAFTSDADFSDISNQNLFLGSVVQKTFINVTESGTEAAAATAGLFHASNITIITIPISIIKSKQKLKHISYYVIYYSLYLIFEAYNRNSSKHIHWARFYFHGSQLIYI